MRKSKYSGIIFTICIVILVVGGAALLYYLMRPLAPQPPDSSQTIAIQQVSSGYTQPTGIVSTNDDDRLYIVEQAGTIRHTTPGQSGSEVFMDITDKVVANGEMGLLGLAFHPDYAENGYIFVNYIDKNENTVIARYHAADGKVDPASEKVILQVEQPYSNHNGGDLAFGPDGYLYASLGDGGSASDPKNNAQDLNTLLGKVLRLDINTDQPYTIPTNNPFVSRDDARPEIWAYGLRNPWRISFDSQTGDLYIADVGQGEREEVNFQPASSRGGENYGWRCFEGTNEYNMEGCIDPKDFIKPIVEYGHDEGRCSITGGYAYRGTSQPTMEGKYFYGDFCGGQLYYAQRQGETWQQTLALETDLAISAFGVDSSEELYVADYDGGIIYKIEVTSAQEG